jgi:hypothetical protein
LSNRTKHNKFINFYEALDYIATYYILSSDFQSLSKLTEKEYCDNLVVLTTEIIQEQFTDLEVTYLEQRIKNGLEVNEMAKDKILFLNKDQLDNLEIKTDAHRHIRKKRICIGIAKYYVKIAHLYASLMMTINPSFIYKDNHGNIIKKSLLEKQQIPKNVNKVSIRSNICDNRINALKRGDNVVNNNNNNNNEEKDDKIIMNPEICSMNIGNDNSIKNLSNEPGMQELLHLYLDDEYDYSSGKFTGMTEETRKQFQKDLKTFYKTFTGKNTMGPEIKTFSDIKLKDAGKQYNNCQGEEPVFDKKYVVDKNDHLFIAYSKNIRNMINRASTNQEKLLAIINEIFTFDIDSHTQKKKIRINPNLTEQKLQKVVERARKIIVELYVTCEKDYVNGIKLYEAIVETKIIETTQNQGNTLKREQKKIIENLKDMKNKK